MSYVNARCAAITKAGHRCTGRWASALPCTFAWDPVKGVGIDGPWIVLCHRHRTWQERGRVGGGRIRLVHGGWLGAANQYGYGSAAFSSRTGWKPARWWWRRRSDVVFGQTDRRRDAA